MKSLLTIYRGQGRRAVEVFQEDRYSHRERMARQTRSPVTRYARWRGAGSSVDRFFKIWWWSICGLVGAAFGYCVAVALFMRG